MQNLRRGNYALAVTTGIFVFMGFSALVVDMSRVRLTQLEAQSAADAGAHAALVEIKKGSGESYAKLRSHATMHENQVAFTDVTVDAAEDIVFGEWDFGCASAGGTNCFDDQSSFINAVAVQVRKTTDSPMGALDLLLLPIFGAQYAQANSEGFSIAALRSREMVIVQDITGSFFHELEWANEGNIAFLDHIYDTGFPDDMLGMVHFHGPGVLWQELVDVQGNQSTLENKFATTHICQGASINLGSTNYSNWKVQYGVNHAAGQDSYLWQSSYNNRWYIYHDDNPAVSNCYVNGGNTNQGAGLDMGINHFLTASQSDPEALHILILVSDGKPIGGINGEGGDTAWRTSYAYDRAAYAASQDISIFSVSYEQNFTAGSAQDILMGDMAQGIGQYYPTPDPTELPEILSQIAEAIPVAIVQ